MARPLARNSAKGWTTYVAIALLFPASLTSIYWTRKPSITTGSPIGDTRRISAYDEIIQKLARSRGLDWRLVASMISVESSFRHDAVSNAGARGLMQVMPVVAREQQVALSDHPEGNISLGLAHFTKKMKLIKGRTSDDALRLSLTAYNVGLGHLRDAQNLAIAKGKSPRRWKDVSEMLLLLENFNYYEKAKYGYCQGTAVIEYVNRVMHRYQKFQNIYPTNPVQVVTSEEASALPRT